MMLSRKDLNKNLEQEIEHEKKVKLLKKILKIFLIIFLTFSIIVCYMYFIGTRFIKTNDIIINDTFPSSFEGVKILHLTDFFYDSIDESSFNNLQLECQKLNPDIVIFTGNLFNKEYSPTSDDIEKLNNFFESIPYKLGKFAVRGDVDTANFDLIMDNTNFSILDNEKEIIYNENSEYINIIGLNGEKKEIEKDDNYTITIINNYDLYKEYNLTSNLVFAGHNLGGEIKIIFPLISNGKYMDNYYNENYTKVYISNGIGSIHHLRFFNHPSINIYRLYQ